jgi:hypothetical protein
MFVQCEYGQLDKFISICTEYSLKNIYASNTYIKVEIGKVVPIPNQLSFWPEPGPKFFYGRKTETKIFFSPRPGTKTAGPAHG